MNKKKYTGWKVLVFLLVYFPTLVYFTGQNIEFTFVKSVIIPITLAIISYIPVAFIFYLFIEPIINFLENKKKNKL